MKSYIIEGGKKLEGTVKISGSKNASLPILAATILSEKTNKLYNVPQIKDTKTTLEILKLLGCKIKQNSGKIEINSKHITKTEIPEHLMREMRSTVIMAGALLGRFKEVTFSYPGGCDIGSRPIDLHINAFKKLGVEITEEAGFIKCKANKIICTNIDLYFPNDEVKIYKDDGYSAKNLSRPEMKRMLDDVYKRKIHTIVAFKLDRLTRSVIETYKLIKTVME